MSERMPMAERIARALEAKRNEGGRETPQPQPVERAPAVSSLEDFRRQVREREAASLAPLIAAEKARLYAELSGMTSRDRQALLASRERDLARDEGLMAEAGQIGGITPANEAAYRDAWRSFGSPENWEKQVKARRAAMTEVQQKLAA